MILLRLVGKGKQDLPDNIVYSTRYYSVAVVLRYRISTGSIVLRILEASSRPHDII